ncbi:MAG: hypothetical protein WA476_03420 [Acidobacteriaceae bacterium]
MPTSPEDRDPKDWVAEFRRQTEAIRAAAGEWAIRWQEPEGRFISSLLGAIEIVGRLTISVQSAIDAAAKESRTAAEAELAKARDLQQSAHLALMQARNLQLGAITEQENVTIRMIDQTLPLFVERLEKVLVIREQRWNTDVKRRRYAAAGAVVLAVFLAGFGLSWWQDRDRVAAMDQCLDHPLQAAGHYYCSIDTLFGPPANAGK